MLAAVDEPGANASLVWRGRSFSPEMTVYSDIFVR